MKHASALLFALSICTAARASTRDTVAGGAHWRYETEHGPVHVWRPEGYDRKSAGMVVYLHGLYSDVDEAWREHRLADQFAASRQNALFVVPEAPREGAEPPRWDSLEELLATVWRSTKATRPPGPLIVAGHSAAYRSILPWLADPAIQHVILIDALYGNEDDYANWWRRTDGATPKRITLVATKGTYKWTEPFVKKLPHATVAEIPNDIDELSKPQRSARLLYLRTQVGHMELITEGKVLPVLLRRTALKRLPDPVTEPQ